MKGRNNPRFGTIISKSNYGRYKNIFMRSSYELNFARWLDGSNIKWKYESRTFDLGNTTYTPDFYLIEFNCYIEIKGYWYPKSLKKFIKFKKQSQILIVKFLIKKIYNT